MLLDAPVKVAWQEQQRYLLCPRDYYVFRMLFIFSPFPVDCDGLQMGINVLSLMWIRTTINFQYRYGTGTMEAFRTLYKDGGIPRFYRGLLPALIQGPLSRFGDTAANTGTLAALEAFEFTSNLPVGLKTVAASVGAAGFRILLMPVDTFKTTMFVHILIIIE
jgi:hypothetical protein